MITLHQPPPAWGLPNMSPFCAKLETYLRMTKVEYRTAPGNPLEAPKGTIPYVTIDGKKIGDSEQVIEYLKQTRGDPLDARLTPEQRALGLAVRRMLEEHLIFCAAYLRWKDEASYAHVKDFISKLLPRMLAPLIMIKMRKDMLRRMKEQGIARHGDAEIVAMARDDLASLSQLLGGKPFFFGDEPTSIDAVLYGFLVQLLWVPYDSEINRAAKSFANFEPYCQRMKARYWA